MNISVNLTKRVTTPEGQRFYPVVGANNGRVKPDWVWMDGKEVRCPKGTYYIDYTESSGKRVRTSVGTVAAEAQASRLRKEAELRAIAQGLSVTPTEGEPASAQKRPIALAIVDFLEEVKLTKDTKTWKGYEIALGYFQESCPKVHLETLERKDLLKFAAFLKTAKKQSPRSVHNKFACLLTFLSTNGSRRW